MLNNITYCLPIQKKTKQEVLETISNNKDHNLYEIWLDYIEDFDLDFIEKLLEKYESQLIFLVRRKNLEETKLSLETKYAIIKLLENKQAYLDIDISQSDDLAIIEDGKITVRLITSYHNYSETPDDQMLETIIKNMQYHKPSMKKIATFCQTESDAVRLLQLMMNLKNSKDPFIVLGMGKHGMITRIAGALWGNAINFTPNNQSEESAPGQITKKQLETIIAVFDNKN